jgi:hypothetical protein
MSTDNWIQLAAAVVALSALTLALLEGFWTRRHNELSVKPLLFISHHLAGSQGRFGLTVSNNGLGPALVRGYTLEVDGKPMEEKEGDNGWQSAIDILRIRGLEDLKFDSIGPHRIIPAGESVWLLWTSMTETNKQQLEKLLRPGNVWVGISYESIYRSSRSRDVATYGTRRAT